MPPSSSQLQSLAQGLALSLSDRNVTEAQAAALRSCFPNGVYLSLTTALSRGSSVDLYEHHNLVQPGQLQSNVYPGTTPSAAAEAIAANQNIFYDEAIHKQRATLHQDFVQLSTNLDCSAIVCVPLPCHSKMSSAQQLALDPRAVCRHCTKPLVMMGNPLGCLTLGLKRRTNFSIREVLAKMVVLAGCLGPKLASGNARSPGAAPRAPTAASQAMVNLALESSFYTPTMLPPRHTNSPPGAMAGMSNRRHSIDSASSFGAGGSFLSGPSRVRGPSLPTLGEGPPFGTLGQDPYIADYQRRASVDTWMLNNPSGTTFTPDGRLSLDSQTSAASHMLMGSRGSSMDAGVRGFAPAAPLVSLPESFATLALPGGASLSNLSAHSINPFAGSFHSAGSGLWGANQSLSAPDPVATSMPMLQEAGLLDLLNASPDKLELLRALQQLHMEQQAVAAVASSMGMPTQGSGFGTQGSGF